MHLYVAESSRVSSACSSNPKGNLRRNPAHCSEGKNNTLLYKPTVKCIYFHLFGMFIRNGVSERSVKYSTLVEMAVSNPGLLCEWAISGNNYKNSKLFFYNQSLK